MSTVCPICKSVIEPEPEAEPSPGASPPPSPAFRPFCSQRCKLADLHNWFSGEYRISTPLQPSDLDDDEVKLS